MKTMKIGIIGAGFAGSAHARALAALDDVELAIVDEPNREKAARLAADVAA